MNVFGRLDAKTDIEKLSQDEVRSIVVGDFKKVLGEVKDTLPVPKTRDMWGPKGEPEKEKKGKTGKKEGKEGKKKRKLLEDKEKKSKKKVKSGQPEVEIEKKTLKKKNQWVKRK